MMQILNYCSGAISSSLPSSRVIKSSILTVSTVASISGIAAGILSKNSFVSGVSSLMAVTNVIAWMDLGASEDNKSFRENVINSTEGEKREGVLIRKLHVDLAGLEKKINEIQGELTAMSEENGALLSEVMENKTLIEGLQKREEGRTKEIDQLTKTITQKRAKIRAAFSSLQRVEEDAATTITKLLEGLQEADGKIETLQSALNSAEKSKGVAEEAMAKALKEAKEEIKTLKGRVSELENPSKSSSSRKYN